MKRIEQSVSGGCQCGAVRFRATAVYDNAHLCHCRMCQKAVGNLFAALVAIPKDSLVWTRGAPATWRSSEHVERGFCGECGTPLTYDDVRNERINVTIGALDEPIRFKPVSQDSIEGRMPWFDELVDVPDFGETDQPGQSAWAAAIKATNRQHPDHDTDDWPP